MSSDKVLQYKGHTITISQDKNPYKAKNSFLYRIEGFLFSRRNNNYLRLDFSSIKLAETAARKAIDEEFANAHREQELSRLLVQKEFEEFLKYLKNQEVPENQIHSIAAQLTAATIQKQLLQKGISINKEVVVSGQIFTE